MLRVVHYSLLFPVVADLGYMIWVMVDQPRMPWGVFDQQELTSSFFRTSKLYGNRVNIADRPERQNGSAGCNRHSFTPVVEF